MYSAWIRAKNPFSYRTFRPNDLGLYVLRKGGHKARKKASYNLGDKSSKKNEDIKPKFFWALRPYKRGHNAQIFLGFMSAFGEDLTPELNLGFKSSGVKSGHANPKKIWTTNLKFWIVVFMMVLNK